MIKHCALGIAQNQIHVRNSLFIQYLINRIYKSKFSVISIFYAYCVNTVLRKIARYMMYTYPFFFLHQTCKQNKVRIQGV